ncbi:MAG: hypothetical protein ACPGUI_00545 [Halarcobacter sp.]
MTIEKITKNLPNVFRVNALHWWIHNPQKRANASFFLEHIGSLEERRAWAIMLNNKEFKKLFKILKGVSHD